MRRAVRRLLVAVCLAAVAALSLAGTGRGASKPAAGGDLRTSLLHPGDVAGGFSKIQYKLFPHFTKKMSLSKDLWCGGNPYAPIKAGDWKQGMIQVASASDGSYVQSCGIVFKTVAAAKALNLYNIDDMNAEIQSGKVRKLPIARIGNESLGAGGQDSVELAYLLDFRHGAAVFEVAYLGLKQTGRKLLTPAQFGRAARVINSRYH